MTLLTPKDINAIPADQPVLIAGPTASGKSALALEIASTQGGVIVNADALQVYDNWRVLSARPSAEDEAAAQHLLYGHLGRNTPYSVGHWLRDIDGLLTDLDPTRQRPIIVGGTGLYFTALTQGLAEIPATPPDIRALADHIRTSQGLDRMIQDLDPETCAKLDLQNPMRVQRAWEVQSATGQSITWWQGRTPAPKLSLSDCFPILVDLDKNILNQRIEKRFALMIDLGALDEAAENLPTWDPSALSAKTIGAPELIAHLRGEITLDQACELATIATRQFAKRQRTWFRSKMRNWNVYQPNYK